MVIQRIAKYSAQEASGGGKGQGVHRQTRSQAQHIPILGENNTEGAGFAFALLRFLSWSG